MRANRLAIFVLLAATPSAFAQSDDLTSVLRGWEKSLAEAKTIATEVRRDSYDTALKSHDVHDGGLVFAKAGNQQRFCYELRKSGTVSEKFVSDGKNLYEYVPATKVVRVRNMPNAKDGALGLMSLAFDLNPQRAQARYTMMLEKANNASDKDYYYIRISPKEARDKSEFQEAVVVLQRSNHMPRQIAYQLNNVIVTWDFNSLKMNGQIPEKLLTPDTNGWRVERVPAK